jgi:hypothetical protein
MQYLRINVQNTYSISTATIRVELYKMQKYNIKLHATFSKQFLGDSQIIDRRNGIKGCVRA